MFIFIIEECFSLKNDVLKVIDTTIKKIWTDDLSIDHDKSYILKEDSLKNAFYFHLRTRLGDCFLNENNLRIFNEYKIEDNRIDLVIVE